MSRNSKPIDKNILHQKYVIEGLSASEISRQIGRSLRYVFKYLEIYSIPRHFPKVKITDTSLLGYKFNDFVVIRYVGKNYNGRLWECECKCGKLVYKSTTHIRTHASVKCFQCTNNDKKDLSIVPNYMMKKIRKNAIIRNLEFTITKDYIEKLLISQNYKCKLSGQQLIIAKKDGDYHAGEFTASLDRIDNNKGYIEGNVQWVHKDINWMKNTYSQEDFIKMCCLVADFQKGEVNGQVKIQL